MGKARKMKKKNPPPKLKVIVWEEEDAIPTQTTLQRMRQSNQRRYGDY